MRICLLSREFPPDTGWGGVGTYTLHMAQALTALGHDVHVIALAAAGGADSRNESEDYTVHRVCWDGVLDELNLLLVLAPTLHFVAKTGIALWRRFLAVHAVTPFDVVEAPEHLACGFFNAISSAAPLVVKLHTPHAKFVSDNYNGVLPSWDNQMVALFERAGITQADAVCSPSDDLAQFVCRDTGIARERVRIVRNPVDTGHFVPDREPLTVRDQVRNVPTMLFVGRVEQRKGIDCLVNALPRILQEVPNAKLRIVGADTQTAPDGGSMKQYLLRKLATQGNDGAVEFIPHVPLTDLPNIYRSADVCLIPSVYDNAPYTCLEAMSCGRPVIVSDKGGTQEYVQQGHTGFIVAGGDPEPLAKAAVSLLRNQQLARTMGANARDYVVNTLSREVIAAEMVRLYQEASQTFKANTKLFLKPPQELLTESLSVLCALDAALFDMMSDQSLSFRMKHWLRFLSARPALALATAMLAFAQSLHLNKLAPTRNLVRRLEENIQSRQGPRYQATMQYAQRSSAMPTTETPVVRGGKS